MKFSIILLSLSVVLTACIGRNQVVLYPLATEETVVDLDGLEGRWFAELDNVLVYVIVTKRAGPTYEVQLAITPNDPDYDSTEEEPILASSIEARIVALGGRHYVDATLASNVQDSMMRRIGPFVLIVHQIVGLELVEDELRLRPFDAQAMPSVETVKIPDSNGDSFTQMVTSTTETLQRLIANDVTSEELFSDEPIVLHRSQPGERPWYGEPPIPYDQEDAFDMAAHSREELETALTAAFEMYDEGRYEAQEELFALASRVGAAQLKSDWPRLKELFLELDGELQITPGSPDPIAGILSTVYPSDLVSGPIRVTERVNFNPGNPGPVVAFQEFIAGWVRWFPGQETVLFPELTTQLEKGSVSGVVIVVPAIAEQGTRIVLVMQFAQLEDGSWRPHSAQVVSTRTTGDQPTEEFKAMF